MRVNAPDTTHRGMRCSWNADSAIFVQAMCVAAQRCTAAQHFVDIHRVKPVAPGCDRASLCANLNRFASVLVKSTVGYVAVDERMRISPALW